MIRVTKDGKIFAKLEEGLVQGWKECDEVAQVAMYVSNTSDEPTKQELPKWVGAPVDAQLVGNVLALIKHYKSFEVMVSLYYNPDTHKWAAAVPKQKGSGAHVKYDDSQSSSVPQGYYFSGTIHSHPNMGAFWSSTDTNDQNGKTGLHMVVGTNSDGTMTSHLCSLFLMGIQLDAQGAFLFPESLPKEPPAEWVACIDKWRAEKPAYTVVAGSRTTKSSYTYNPYTGSHTTGALYRFDDSEFCYQGASHASRRLYSIVEGDDLEDVIESSFAFLPPRTLDLVILWNMIDNLLIPAQLKQVAKDELNKQFINMTYDTMRSQITTCPQEFMDTLTHLADMYIPELTPAIQDAVSAYVDDYQNEYYTEDEDDIPQSTGVDYDDDEQLANMCANMYTTSAQEK